MRKPAMIGAAVAIFAGAALTMSVPRLAASAESHDDAGPVPPVQAARAEAAALPPATDAELRRWIVGGWAQAGADCAGEGKDVYEAGGRYAAFAREGRWRIEAGKLIVTITREMRTDMLDPQPMRAVADPSPTILSLTRETEDRMHLDANGERMRMVRCPTLGRA